MCLFFKISKDLYQLLEIVIQGFCVKLDLYDCIVFMELGEYSFQSCF